MIIVMAVICMKFVRASTTKVYNSVYSIDFEHTLMKIRLSESIMRRILDLRSLNTEIVGALRIPMEKESSCDAKI